MTAELNPQQLKFIELIVHGDMTDKEACIAAGYSEGTNPSTLKARLSEEIVKEVAKKIAGSAPKAAKRLLDLLDDPTVPGSALLEKVTNSVLEKAGIVKKDKIEIEHTVPNAILELPPKNKLNKE